MLNKYAPLKRKLLRVNHASYVSKAMRKAIMKRSSWKKRTEESLRTYKKQKNYCSTLYKKEKKILIN